MEYLVTGIILGLSAGLSPGPLFSLVLSESLRHGAGAGIRVALAPLITDLPIIGVSLLFLTHLSESGTALGIISLMGGVFVAYLGFETFSSREPITGPAEERPQSMGKGIMTNFLSPYPYLFWISVGSPSVFKAYGSGRMKAAMFVLGFYSCLCGSKVILAMLTSRGRHLIFGKPYLLCMKALGVLLWLFAASLFSEAARLLGLMS